MPPQSPQASASLPEGGATAFSPSGLRGCEFISIPWRVIFSGDCVSGPAGS